MVSMIHAINSSGRVGAIADNGPRIAKRDRRMKGGLGGLGKTGIGVLNAGSLFLTLSAGGGHNPQHALRIEHFEISDS